MFNKHKRGCGWDNTSPVCMAMFADENLSSCQSQLGHWTVQTGLQSVWVAAAGGWSVSECLRATQAWLCPVEYQPRTLVWTTRRPEWGHVYSPNYKCRICGNWPLRYRMGRILGQQGGCKIRPCTWKWSRYWIPCKDVTCPLPWMSYRAGDQLPFGTVTGGQLADGTVTYVVKVNHQGYISFGYYEPNAAVAYYERFGVQTTTSMDILVLL